MKVTTKKQSATYFNASGDEVSKNHWSAEYAITRSGKLGYRYYGDNYAPVLPSDYPQWYKDLTCDSCGGEGEYTSHVAGVGIVDEVCKICHGKGWVL